MYLLKHLAVFALFCGSVPLQQATAQNSEQQTAQHTGDKKSIGHKKDINGFYFLWPVEFPIIDVSGINSVLGANGLPDCKYPAATIGGGLQFQHNHVIALISYSGLIRRPVSDSIEQAIKYGSISLNVGYDIIKKPHFSLFPYAGFKNCTLNYLYNQKTMGNTSINNYLSTSLDHKEIRNSRANLDLGIGFSHQWFYLIGVRAGYLLPLSKEKWTINNGKVALSNTPGIHYRGYIMVTVGFGSVSPDNMSKKWRKKHRHTREHSM